MQLRQTLLSFAPRAAAQSTTDSQRESQQLSQPGPARNLSSQRRAPDLPEEVWCLILGPLGLLALKTLRLVCRDWAIRGAPWLYSTLYLNCYKKCWDGLVAISKSNYACHVTRIVWNPLVLMEECLDAAIWKSRYPNLLRGLTHGQTLHFYETFVKVYKSRISLLRSSSLDPMSEALASLHNCREIILADDYDVETSCSDPFLRTRIQGSAELLGGPLVWSLSPRMWKETSENTDALTLGPEVFRILQNCPSVTNMTMDFWAAHSLRWTEILSPYCVDRQKPNSKYSGVSCLTLVLKFCPSDWLDSGSPSTQRALSDLFGSTMSLPELTELTVKPLFVDPGKEYMQFCLDQQRNDRSDDGEYFSSNWSDAPELLNAFTRPDCSASLLTALQADQEGWTEAVYKTVSAEFRPEFVQIPKLRLLRLYDLTVDSRLFLCWLSSQKHLPTSQLTLELHGIVIIFGLDNTFVRKALASLNVHLRYGTADSVCYFPDSQDTTEVPHIAIEATEGRCDVRQRYWIHEEWPPSTVGDMVTPNILDRSILDINPLGTAQVLSRSNDFEDLIVCHGELEREVSYFTYRARLSKGIVVWEWIEGSLENTFHSFDAEQSRAVPLLRATIRRYRPYYDSYGDYDDYWHTGGEAEVQTREQIEDLQEEEEQHLLLMYETELFGLDLVGEYPDADRTDPNYDNQTYLGRSYR